MQTSSQSLLTGQQLIDIRTRAEAATKGPWGSHRDLAGVYTVQVNPRVIPGFGSVAEGDVAQILTREDDKAYANVRFVAAARTDVPALLDNIELLERTYQFDTAELKRKADQALQAAIEAARSEYLVDNTDSDEDRAYNQGVSDAIAAIGRLLAGGAL